MYGGYHETWWPARKLRLVDNFHNDTLICGVLENLLTRCPNISDLSLNMPRADLWHWRAEVSHFLYVLLV